MELRTEYPARIPSLLANFIRITSGDSINTNPNATSELYYIISGTDAAPGTYTLIGDKVDPETSEIIDPIRIDWVPGKAFVTPPGLWHSHHNESGEPAFIIPIQDAGLQTYLRTLDIQFTHYDQN